MVKVSDSEARGPDNFYSCAATFFSYYYMRCRHMTATRFLVQSLVLAPMWTIHLYSTHIKWESHLCPNRDHVAVYCMSVCLIMCVLWIPISLNILCLGLAAYLDLIIERNILNISQIHNDRFNRIRWLRMVLHRIENVLQRQQR